MMSALLRLIEIVENNLALFYSFAKSANANDHIIDRDRLEQGNWPSFAGQGAVTLAESNNSDEIFLGISFAEEVVQALGAQNPADILNSKNLNAACVVIEEVSHFHLIINRAKQGLQVSQLELEWQGEIDKLLVCGMLLHEQCGLPHLLPLARQIYDQAVIIGIDNQRYQEATKYAARFWFNAIANATSADNALFDADVRKSLMRAYGLPWNEKIAQTSRTLPKAANR